MKIGLKLWSTNDFYIPCLLPLYNNNFFDYIELFIVPHSMKFLHLWDSTGIPVVLHAPHEMKGLNLSIVENRAQNIELIKEVEEYRLGLNALKIIFHPGISGEEKETIAQINFAAQKFPDLFNRAVIENNPKVGLNNERCVGYNYNAIDTIKKETRLEFCLDFGHAIVSSGAEQIPWKDKIEQMLSLNPVMYHLSDGDTGSIMDKHLHFGEGNFDIAFILGKISGETAMISLETPKNSTTNLDDFIEDVCYLKEILS